MSSPPNLLFDTQAVIQWARDETTKRVVSLVDAGSPVYVSIVSYWEFLLKDAYHDLGIQFEDLEQIVAALDAKVLDIKLAHLKTLRRLPFIGRHRDPFDRLLISQAISEGYALVGNDNEFSKYSETPIGRDLTVIWR